MSKLRGGFDALVDFLALAHGPASLGLGGTGASNSLLLSSTMTMATTPGGGWGFAVGGRVFPPLLERHDAMAWERWR